ncbi:MAG: hypothetical protein ABJO57_00855 [Lentilitoribacter sp.]
MTLRLLPSQAPHPAIPDQNDNINSALDIAVGDWADGNAIDIDQYRHQMNIWLDEVLSGLVLHKNVAPEDIQIDQAEIGGYRLPLVRVFGRPQAMFWPYLEKQTV